MKAFFNHFAFQLGKVSCRSIRLWFWIAAGFWATPCLGGQTVWNFDNPADPLAASSGAGYLDYYDPDGTGWAEDYTVFAKASAFSLPAMPGGDPDVMKFPACTPRQGYRLWHQGTPNGPYGESAGKVSNYTLILDLLYPAESDGRWRAIFQTDTNNTDDAESYVQDIPGGGIGTRGVYHGSIPSNSWHRVAIVMQAAPGEGKCQRFIDGRFVGGIGSTGSGLDIRWALDAALLLFTDEDGETGAGYVSSISFVDRAMTMEEIQALGGPHAAGADVAGDPAPPITQRMPRRVGVIGHRGGFFCCAPDNTMAGIRRAISNNVPVVEIDTRLSADGVCVLMHDPTVDRTTDGTGAVAGMTVAQLKSLDAGSWFSPEFIGEQVPTLEEVMTEAKGKLILYFDLKVPGQINAITNALALTGFDPNDCWFWTYGILTDMASIRGRLPNAKFIWADPAANWATDANYFANLRNLGVVGFDLAVYYGTANHAFVRAAKEQGFMIACYTMLDPDGMVLNAAAGVDYMETDFPQIMNLVQPPQSGSAAGPIPADGATGVFPSPTLMWITATNATAHRVFFGTNSNPPLYREQTHDLVACTNLALSTQYFWRVDEVTPLGVATGAVWQFTTTNATPPASATYEWTFDQGDLSATLGDGVMAYADTITPGLTTFGVTDGSSIPHLNGEAGSYMHVPAFTGLNNGYLLSFTSSPPNGGGGYINRYTFIADVLVPGPLNWTPFFNTSPGNANDADWYVASDGSLGIGELGYSAGGVFAPNTWTRIAFAADLAAGVVTYYRNGTQVFQRTTTGLLDGRFSLYGNVHPGADLLLFNEGDTDGVYTHELYVASVAFTDRTLSAAEVLALAGPRAEGIFVQRLQATRNGTEIALKWAGAPNVKLQRSSTLPAISWLDVPNTAGTSNYTATASGEAQFYRLIRQ